MTLGWKDREDDVRRIRAGENPLDPSFGTKSLANVHVTLRPDIAVAALRTINERASKAFTSSDDKTAWGDALCDIVGLCGDALAKCQAEQGEVERLQAALRELATTIRTWLGRP